MKEPRFLTSRAQYTLVYQKGKAWASDLLVMRAMPNGLGLSRYGFSVTKRVGKAVQRNRVKRLLREIMRKQSLRSGWDIVFIARSSAVESSYHELESTVTGLLNRARLLEANG